MESIDDIHALFSGIQLANLSANRWYIEPIPSLGTSRILLSRGPSEEYCLFIKGPLTSFGHIPLLASIEHREDAMNAVTGERFPALRIFAPNIPQGNTVVAHIVYEFIRQIGEDPEVDNASLILRVNWMLQLLGRQGAPMSPENQRGLAAECLLLSQLLSRGRELGVGPEAVIDKWVRGRRDFFGGGISVEVKATAHNVRRHHISSLGQLDKDDDSEKVFIYSVGLRHDSSTSKCLADYIRAIEEQLITPNGNPLPAAREAFEAKLASAGYDSSHEGVYRSGDGILQNTVLPPRLFPVEDLDRLTISSFKNDQLPIGVASVSYDIEIFSEPLSFSAMNEILASLVEDGT